MATAEPTGFVIEQVTLVGILRQTHQVETVGLMLYKAPLSQKN